MEYIKQFTNHSEYLVFTNTDKFVKPNVSYCIAENENHYNPLIPPDYSQEYLTFVAKADGTFKFSGSTTANTLSYSLDNGSTWTELANNTNSPTVTSGSKILWKGNCTPQTSTGIGKFTSTAQFDIEGNAMSLLFGDDFKGQESLEGKGYAFWWLFGENTNVISAKNLSLPATTLASFCYTSMFNGCTNLTTAPQLPATTLKSNCYSAMFGNCTNLTTAPQLHATTLASTCYSAMFGGCTSLTTAPELPATKLASSCYRDMFRDCTNLITAPTLPSTNMYTQCYQGMFSGCTSLTTAPELPATSLDPYCYSGMFKSCTSLTAAPQLPATTLATGCYGSMFQGCTSLTTAPELPATTLSGSCYYTMFYGCTNLNYIKAMFTTTPSSTYTSNWVSGVASSGTFVKNASAAWDVTGNNGIPTGWTVETASS